MIGAALACGIGGGATGNRVRGGLWGKLIRFDEIARLAWALPCGATAWLAGIPPLWSGAITAAMWASCSIGLFGSLSMGHGANPLWRDWLGMTAFTIGRLALTGGILAYLHHSWWWLLPMIPLGPLAYWLSWHQPFTVWWLKVVPAGGDGVHPFEGPTFGEVAWGALAGGLLAVACHG